MTTALRVVQNKLTRPGGEPIAGQKVTFRLHVPAFADAGTREIARECSAVTDETGLWQSPPLEENSGADPSTDYWTVKEGPNLIWAFVVVAGTGALWLRDCLVDAPTNPNPIVVDVTLVGNIDGGNPFSVYSPGQIIDCGAP